MRYLSVCSGIEAVSRAWHPLGWVPAAFAEIDPAPCSVLRERYPNVRNLGDFTGIRRRWARRIGIGSIDILVGGTPCQSFSVAGLRGGMADARGNLALEFLRLARRFRPPWVVWENVPGVLSSNGGRDFGAFLGGLEKLGYGWAYRVLDAQHFGVPQRRRRVFVVGYSGDVARLGGTPSREDVQRFSRISAAVLFERHSLSGNPPPGRAARLDVASCLGGGSGERGWCDDLDRSGAFVPESARTLLGKQNLSHADDADTLVAFSSHGHGHGHFRDGLGTLTAHDSKDGYLSGLVTHSPEVAFGLQASTGRNENGSRIGNAWNTNYVAHTLRADGFDASEDGTGRGTPLVPDVAPTLFASEGGVSSGYHPVIPIDLRQASRGEKDTNNRATGSGGPTGGGVPFIVNAAESCAKVSHARQSETARCLDVTGGFASSQGGTVVACDFRNMAETGDVASTLQVGGHGASPSNMPHVAAFDPRNVTSNVNRTRVEPGLPCPTLHAQGASIIGQGVRRLTPVECERLQGFPEDWTLVPHRRKPMADGPRYKMCGNSMAVPVVRWLGRRIELVTRTLGLLWGTRRQGR